MSRPELFPPLPPKSQEMKIRQETVRKRSLRKFRRAKQQNERHREENWVENGTRIKGSWRRRWCRVGDVAFNSAVTFFELPWFLRPSQLVEEEETVEDIKEEEEEKWFFCLLRLINSAELIRCQCCSDFGRFVRLISGKKTKKEKEKMGTDDKDGSVLSCASPWLFSVKTTLGRVNGRSTWWITHTFTNPNLVSQWKEKLRYGGEDNIQSQVQSVVYSSLVVHDCAKVSFPRASEKQSFLLFFRYLILIQYHGRQQTLWQWALSVPVSKCIFIWRGKKKK